jgi:hypothetical protein
MEANQGDYGASVVIYAENQPECSSLQCFP